MQAARGASLNSSDPVSPGTSGGTRAPSYLRVFLTVAAGLYLLDVGTKIWAVESLSGRGRVDLLGGWFGFHLTRNPGAAFSSGTSYTVALSCLAVAAVLVIAWLSRRLGSLWWAVGLGSLLAGVAGNLTDRILRSPGPMRGHVVDFLELPNWPIFNVADICINVAVGVILLQAFRGIRIDGTPHDDTKTEAIDE